MLEETYLGKPVKMKMMPEKVLNYSSCLVDLIPGDLADLIAANMTFTSNCFRDLRKDLIDNEKVESFGGWAELRADGSAGADSETVQKIDAALLGLTGKSGYEMRRELEMDFWREQYGDGVDPDKYGAFTPTQLAISTSLADKVIHRFLEK